MLTKYFLFKNEGKETKGKVTYDSKECEIDISYRKGKCKFKNMFLFPRILQFIDDITFMRKLSTEKIKKKYKCINKRRPISYIEYFKLDIFRRYIQNLNIDFPAIVGFLTADIFHLSIGLLNYNFDKGKIEKLARGNDTIDTYVNAKLEIYKIRIRRRLDVEEKLAYFEFFKGVKFGDLRKRFSLFDSKALIYTVFSFLTSPLSSSLSRSM